MKNYDKIGNCKICKKKITGEQDHTGFKNGFAHWVCILQKNYKENMKELPININ